MQHEARLADPMAPRPADAAGPGRPRWLEVAQLSAARARESRRRSPAGRVH